MVAFSSIVNAVLDLIQSECEVPHPGLQFPGDFLDTCHLVKGAGLRHQACFFQQVIPFFHVALKADVVILR